MLIVFSRSNYFFLQGLGLEYSRQLVRRGCRLLVVTSRTGTLPGEVSKEFAAFGCRVVAFKADASHAEDMARVMTHLREQMPHIQHYAHAAGVSGFDMLQDIESKAFWNVADAKVVGAAAAGAAGMAFDSQVLFSSTSAIWSQTGASHYAAANSFLDGVAAARQAAGLPATSLQLGPFAEAGMAADHVAELTAIGLKGLHPKQLQDAVLTAGNAPQMVYARIDAPKFVQLYTAKGRWSLVDAALQVPPVELSVAKITQQPTVGSLSTVGAPNSGLTGANNSRVATSASVAGVIRKVAKDILGDVDADFDDFPSGGFDSLSAVELSSTVGTELGIQLPGTLVYDFPSVRSMAAHVLSLLSPAQGPASSTTAVASSGALVPATVGPNMALSEHYAPRMEYFEVTFASRVAQPIGGTSGLSADAITPVHYGRWNLNSLRVSTIYLHYIVWFLIN